MVITKEKLEKNFGKKCKEYVPLCIVCEVYRAYEFFELALGVGKWKKK